MTEIYGTYTSCDDIKKSCECTYTYCEHTKDILKRYGASIYGTNHLLRQIIQVLLDYQEESIKTLCETPLSLKPLVKLLGFDCCYYQAAPQNCIQICGGNYRPYEFNDCISICQEQSLTDDTLLRILLITEYLSYPSRDNIQAICDIFGWTLVYTNYHINILLGSDDPSVYKFIIDMIPVPIGEEIRILTDC